MEKATSKVGNNNQDSIKLPSGRQIELRDDKILIFDKSGKFIAEKDCSHDYNAEVLLFILKSLKKPKK